jgi:acyl-CoA synthetase (AMP-forming)/AMP-acid ligase II
VAEFFDAIGLLILEGYGLTETTAAITVNTPFDYRFGTVGKPIGDVKLKIAADGEVLSLSAKDFGRWLADDSKIPLKFLLPFVTTLSARLRDTTREMAAFFEVSRVLVQNLEIKDMAGRLLDVMAQPFNGEIQAAPARTKTRTSSPTSRAPAASSPRGRSTAQAH